MQCVIDDLPDEILEYILNLIPPYKDLQECMLVCKRWCRVARSKLTSKYSLKFHRKFSKQKFPVYLMNFFSTPCLSRHVRAQRGSFSKVRSLRFPKLEPLSARTSTSPSHKQKTLSFCLCSQKFHVGFWWMHSDLYDLQRFVEVGFTLERMDQAGTLGKVSVAKSLRYYDVPQ